MTYLLSRSESKRDLRRLASKSLLAFTRYTKPDYRVNWHHERLAEKLDRVAAGQCRRLMVFMPPQHGKSELVSRRLPAYLLGNNPDLRLIACSHTNDLAISMNRDVQRIMTGSSYRAIFSEVALDRSPQAIARPGGAGKTHGPRPENQDTIVARRTLDFFELPGHRGSLRSAGVGNSIVGNPADGLIIDDPFGKREDAESPLVRERIWEWYNSDLYTRQAKDGWIVLTHTRWHRDDLAGRLLRKMADRSGDQWEILCLPAVREEGPGDPCDTRALGQVLWPAFKSAADLEIIRRQDPRTYGALYQQNPADASGAEWSAELFGDWMWVPPERWPTDFVLRVVCVDASKGRSDKHGDYSAIVFLGLGKDQLIYIDAVIERIPLDQIVRKTIAFCDEKQPQYVGIEAEQFQELLLHEFRRQCAQAGKLNWPLYGLTTHGLPKAVARIRQLTQYISERNFRFKADSPGCRLLVEQLMDFPLADHDDGPDALEMCIRLPLEVRQSREEVSYFYTPNYRYEGI